MHYFCLPPSPGNIILFLDEDGVSGGDFLVGAATCDGKSHTLTTTLVGLFTPGIAAGTATVENTTGSAMATANQRVGIK